MRLSIIIPVFNEEKTIAEIIKRVMAVKLPKVQKEVIIVDDNSIDATKKILKRISKKWPRLKIFYHQKNQGKGGAVKTGLVQATGDYVLIQDADLEYDPQDIPRLFKPIQDGKAEVVYGSRFTGEHRNMFFWHMIGNKLISLITNVFYNSTLSDVEVCYKLFKRQLLKPSDLKEKRWGFDPEITINFLKNDVRIYELPISYTGREFDEGKKIRWQDSFRIFWVLLRETIKSNWYSVAFVLILILAAGLRFYLFSSRWALAFDHAHDVLVAREAIRQRKIPLLGAFASGANVVGGPQWYWVIAFFSFLAPRLVTAPWVGLGLLSVFFVWLMMKIASELGDKKLVLIIGLLAVFSPLQISQSVSLTNQSPMALIAAFSFWSLIKYVKTRRLLFAFFLATGIALGINVHLQGIGLIFLFFPALIYGGRLNWKKLLSFLIGFSIQFIPMLIFESRTDFYNLTGLVDYLTYRQYLLGSPSQWRVYLFSFWPNLWSKIVGGQPWLVYLQASGAISLFVYQFLKKRLRPEFLAMVLASLLIFISLRYYRGPRFESYYVFIHPLVIFFSGWFLWRILQWQKEIALVILAFMLLTSMEFNLDHYRVERNGTYPLVKSWQVELVKQFPDQKFAVYDYQSKTRDRTAPLALALTVNDLIDDRGIKIGISRQSETFSEMTFYQENGYFLTQLKEPDEKWKFLNPSAIWQETEEWYW